MNIPLRVIDRPTGSKWDTEVGDMWRAPSRDEGGREAWCIHLPNKAGFWYTTEHPADKPDVMWNVTGIPPQITVTPSINAEPEWHGNITNGVIT